MNKKYRKKQLTMVGYQTFFVLKTPSDEDVIINYSLSEVSDVKIDIYEASGKMVKKFMNETQEKGEYKIRMNTDELPVGMYYIKRSAKASPNKIDNKKRNATIPSIQIEKELKEEVWVAQDYVPKAKRTSIASGSILMYSIDEAMN